MVMINNLYKEAWDEVKDNLPDCIAKESLFHSIELLDSLVSKSNYGRPVEVKIDSYTAFRCPCCNEIIPFGAEGMHYCGHCSARLEWIGLDIKQRADKEEVPGIVQPYSINGYDGDDYLDCRCSHCDASVEYEQRYCNGCGKKLVWNDGWKEDA